MKCKSVTEYKLADVENIFAPQTYSGNLLIDDTFMWPFLIFEIIFFRSLIRFYTNELFFFLSYFRHVKIISLLFIWQIASSELFRCAVVPVAYVKQLK